MACDSKQCVDFIVGSRLQSLKPIVAVPKGDGKSWLFPDPFSAENAFENYCFQPLQNPRLYGLVQTLLGLISNPALLVQLALYHKFFSSRLGISTQHLGK